MEEGWIFEETIHSNLWPVKEIMKLWNQLLSRGLGSGLETVATKIFTTLIGSQTFRKTVVETEKAIIKGIKFAGNPEKGARDFHRSEQEAIDYLAQKAQQSATKGPKTTTKQQSMTSPPSNMTPSGYQPESEWSRWYKTKKYEMGVAKRRWFG